MALACIQILCDRFYFGRAMGSLLQIKTKQPNKNTINSHSEQIKQKRIVFEIKIKINLFIEMKILRFQLWSHSHKTKPKKKKYKQTILFHFLCRSSDVMSDTRVHATRIWLEFCVRQVDSEAPKLLSITICFYFFFIFSFNFVYFVYVF